jgi:hypothetical protein
MEDTNMAENQVIKLKLKTANVEIEYEGGEDFLRSELMGFITEVAEVHKENQPIGTTIQQTNTPPAGVTSGGTINLSVNSIAAKLTVTTGPDLVLAACADLTLALNRDTFSRKDILDSMKTASTYYKKSYSNNFSNYLDGLVRNDKVLQQANDVYALHTQTRSEMESRLGN